jgi:hypothetical protein
VRGGALAQVAALSASIEGRAALTKTDVIRVLVRLIGDVNQSYVKDAMTALINLAEVSVLASQMVDRNVVSRVLDLLIDSADVKMTPLYTMLLSNVTRIPAGARKLLNLDDDASLKGYYIAKLLPLFLSTPNATEGAQAGGNDLSAIGTDRAAWLGSILVNSTTIQEGREIFTDKENRLLKLLIPQISAKNPLRRRAALGVVRNCMFDHKDHEWILNDNMQLLTELLLPLRGPQPFDDDDKHTIGMDERLKNVSPTKVREEDVECKKLILDTLTLFTATRFGREYLKSHHAYPIVRELDRDEKNETVSQKIFDLVHVLLLDDPEDEVANEQARAEAAAEAVRQEAEREASNSEAAASSTVDTPAKAAEPDIDEHGEVVEEL